MSGHLHGFAIHFRVRLATTLSDPFALSLVVLFALASLVFWPQPQLMRAAASGPAVDIIAWVLWLQLWPAIPLIYVGGRATGRGDADFATRGLPALPVGPRMRALAEVAVVALAVLAVRIPALLTFQGHDLAEAVHATLAGLLIMLPTMVSWALPATSVHLYMLRPLVLAVLLLGAMQLGLLGSAAGLVACTAAAAVLAMATLRLDPRPPKLPRGPLPASAMWRPPLEAERQLARDTWLLPLGKFGFLLGAGVAVAVAAVILEQTAGLPWIVVFVSAEAAPMVLVVALLRPFGSPLIAFSLAGRHGARTGDLLRAWSALPVRREAVLRWLWAYGFVLSALGYVLVLAFIVARVWLITGAPALVDSDGDSLARVALPFAGLILCLPALLVALAVGDRLNMVLSGVAILFIFHLHLLLLVALMGMFPRGSPTPKLLHALIVMAVTLIGSLPVLARLKRPGPAVD